MAKKNKALWTTLAVLGIVGGSAHALQGFLNVNLLTMLPYSGIIQGVAGVATILYIVYKMK